MFLERGKRPNYVIFFTIENKEWGIMADQKHIVIVGAGFGGVRLAKELAKENVRVTLVDRHNVSSVSAAALSGEYGGPVRFGDCLSHTAVLQEQSKCKFLYVQGHGGRSGIAASSSRSTARFRMIISCLRRVRPRTSSATRVWSETRTR